MRGQQWGDPASIPSVPTAGSRRRVEAAPSPVSLGARLTADLRDDPQTTLRCHPAARALPRPQPPQPFQVKPPHGQRRVRESLRFLGHQVLCSLVLCPVDTPKVCYNHPKMQPLIVRCPGGVV